MCHSFGPVAILNLTVARELHVQRNEGELKMKKLIAIALMVVCVAGFSLGCKEKAKETPAPATPDAAAPAEGADAAPADAAE